MSGETVPGSRMSGSPRSGGRAEPITRPRIPRRAYPLGAGIAIFAMLPLVVSACSVAPADPPARADAAADKPAAPPSPYGIAPLTGRPADSPEAAKRPALAVAVRAGAKTTGLDSADFVYQEAGSGRLVALFQSKPPPKVGPVAETRPFDAKMLPVTGALLATSGGPDKFVTQLRKAKGLTNLSGYKAGYRGGYAITRNLYRKRPKGAKPPPKLVQYAAPGQSQGTPVSRLTIELPGRDEVWTYDAAQRAWRRSGNPKFTAANVIVQLARFKTTKLERAGTSVPSVRPYGKGTASVASVGAKGGQLSAGTWRKPGTRELTFFSAGRSKPILLTPGRTWVVIAPIGSNVRTE